MSRRTGVELRIFSAFRPKTPVIRPFSPRPWGCSVADSRSKPWQTLLPTPVGMFRDTRRTIKGALTSPHARGDVPRHNIGRALVKHFSPRPWGCSLVLVIEPDPWRASPHARGDVPSHHRQTRSQTPFSPRPWGCSAPSCRPSFCGSLLPTPVGMFRPFV